VETSNGRNIEFNAFDATTLMATTVVQKERQHQQHLWKHQTLETFATSQCLVRFVFICPTTTTMMTTMTT